MSKLKPLSEKALKPYAILFSLVKKSMGFVPNSLKTMARNPGIMNTFSSLSVNIIGKKGLASPWQGIKMGLRSIGTTAKNLNNEERVPLYLRNLVAHVSSNASGCRYCQAHTIEQAHRNGTSIEKIEAVWDFEHSPLFDEAERAALRFGLAAGQVPNEVTEEHFTELRKHFTEDQIIDLGATIALFGFLNRWNDTFGTPLEAEPIAFAEKHLAKSGWEVGKHK